MVYKGRSCCFLLFFFVVSIVVVKLYIGIEYFGVLGVFRYEVNDD